MAARAGLIVGVDVTDALGVERAAEFQAAVTVFTCVECGTPGDVRRELAV